MRRLSLNARMAQDAVSTDRIDVVLFEIEHPLLADPIRLSTDNTERLSDDPLMYCTRSTWRGADPVTEPFLFILADALLPSDLDDAPAAGKIVLVSLDREIVGLLRSFTEPATIHMAVVSASAPDLVEAEWSGLDITDASWPDEITLTFSREVIEREPFPAGRMSRARFPGLHL